MHLVDVTMFWSDQGGGVKRYLAAKSSYFANSTAIRNTVVVPGSFLAEPPDIPGFPLPFSAGYRLPRSKRSVLKVL
jgi:alpha-1,6-mannosyltransferase